MEVVHPTDHPFEVVIAGGGFAAVNCAQALAKNLGSDAHKRVALVADQNFMVFQPMLAEVVGASVSPRHVVNPLRLLCKDITVLRGSITSIDLPGGIMKVNAGNFTGDVSVGFQHLVFALGGVVDLSRVPGMSEHAFLLKNVGDALKLRSAVIDRVEEASIAADRETMQRLLRFVVVGGGYSGVETAGQIRDLGDEILGLYPRLPKEYFRVVLIHSGKHLLPEINESLGLYCEENLRGRGVEIILGARVSAITASKVYIQDRILESHTVVSTIGNAPHPLLVNLCNANGIESEKGRLLTDEWLRVKGQTNLWAAGDCAAVPMPSKKQAPEPPLAEASPFTPRPYCPPTAQFAVRQGTLVGKNLASILNGEGDLEPFTFTGLGELASIGHHAAVAEIMGMRFSGFFAWWLWRTIYLAKLPGLERKLRIIMDWTLDLFFPRDISLFQSRPTQQLKEMRLETGVTHFLAGKPAFSFYLVKSGRIELREKDGSVARTVLPGNHFGERALLHDRIWQYTAVAVEPTELVTISSAVFDTVTSADKPIRDFLLTTAAIR
ncbi:MAG: FAD-dependent oxidoreductase [Verrucomicrobiota bacterium]